MLVFFQFLTVNVPGQRYKNIQKLVDHSCSVGKLGRSRRIQTTSDSKCFDCWDISLTERKSSKIIFGSVFEKQRPKYRHRKSCWTLPGKIRTRNHWQQQRTDAKLVDHSADRVLRSTFFRSLPSDGRQDERLRDKNSDGYDFWALLNLFHSRWKCEKST